MRIAIVGAGGVGGYYGALLARAGHDVILLARGAHSEAIRSRGLEVRTPEGSFVVPAAATDDPELLGEPEYAVIAVKNYSLSEVGPVAKQLAEAGSVIVPLLNGVDVVDRLETMGVPSSALLGGLCAISARRVAPGVVERKSELERVVIGEMAGGRSERAERIVEALRAAVANAEASADITVEIWRKFAFIASVAAACGLARAPLGTLQQTDLGRLLIERAVREAVALAHARDVNLPRDEADSILRFIASLPGSMKPSLLMDLEAGGPTEIDDLSGAVARLGRQAGIATPIHDTAAAVLGGRQYNTAQQ